MSNYDSTHNKVLGECFELAVQNRKLESKEYVIRKENERYKQAIGAISVQLIKYEALILGKPITANEVSCIQKIHNIIDSVSNLGRVVEDKDSQKETKLEKRIDELEQENSKLEAKLNKWQDYALRKEQAIDQIKESIIEVLKRDY